MGFGVAFNKALGHDLTTGIVYRKSGPHHLLLGSPESLALDTCMVTCMVGLSCVWGSVSDRGSLACCGQPWGASKPRFPLSIVYQSGVRRFAPSLCLHLGDQALGVGVSDCTVVGERAKRFGKRLLKKQSPPVREFFSLKGGPNSPKAGRES